MINQPQTIIHAKAGQQVPEELWKAALVQCPTVSGFAIRDTSDDKTTLEIEHYTQTGTVDDMTMLDERAKEYERVYYLANMPGVHTTDDVPWKETSPSPLIPSRGIPTNTISLKKLSSQLYKTYSMPTAKMLRYSPAHCTNHCSRRT